MNPNADEVDSLCLHFFAEDQIHRFHRVSVLLLVLAVVLVASWVWIPLERFALILGLSIAALVGFGQRLGVQRMLILRRNDFFTKGGGANSPIRLSSLSGIEAMGDHLDLVFYDGKRRALNLDFLDAPERHTAATTLIRSLEIYQVAGPLDFPPPREVDFTYRSLRIRLLSESDREFYLAVALPEENRTWQLTKNLSREWEDPLFSAIQLAAQSCPIHWRCVVMESGERIGLISLTLADPILRRAEIGIDLLPSRQNQGLGTDAIQGMIEFARRTTNLVKITSGCFADNTRCRRALEKAGMAYKGTFEKFWFKDKEWKSGCHFEIVL